MVDDPVQNGDIGVTKEDLGVLADDFRRRLVIQEGTYELIRSRATHSAANGFDLWVRKCVQDFTLSICDVLSDSRGFGVLLGPEYLDRVSFRLQDSFTTFYDERVEPIDAIRRGDKSNCFSRPETLGYDRHILLPILAFNGESDDVFVTAKA